MERKKENGLSHHVTLLFSVAKPSEMMGDLHPETPTPKSLDARNLAAGSYIGVAIFQLWERESNGRVM